MMEKVAVRNLRLCTKDCLCLYVCPAHATDTENSIIDVNKCIGCGVCARNCPVDAITRTDYIAPGHKLASFEIDAEKCVKCGVCMGNCKFKAINK